MEEALPPFPALTLSRPPGFSRSPALTDLPSVAPQSGPSPLICVSFGLGLPFRVSTSDFKLIR